MENATTRDDQYLTDLLSYSVDRLGKVRFFVIFSLVLLREYYLFIVVYAL
jgi:hypothetical protein